MNARAPRVLVGVICTLGAASIAAAQEGDPLVVATDPPPPPPPADPVVVEAQVAVDPLLVQPVVVEPTPSPTFGEVLAAQPVYQEPYYDYDDPVYYPTDVFPSESIIATASAMQGWLSQPAGLEQFGRGGTLGFAFLQRDGEFPTGAEATGVFLFGDRASVYDLSLRLIGSPKIGKKLFVPFAAVGLAVGASRVVENGTAEMSTDKDGGDAKYGFAIGPSAAVGLHGFVGKKYYWRAGAGFLGAGIGAITADLGIGIVVD